jgi:hypothetical protein
MDKLAHEAKKKEEDDKAYQRHLQALKDQELQERLRKRQLCQAHAEVLRKQTEDNSRKRQMQRSFDLAPAFDLEAFPILPEIERVSKAAKQQMMAQALERQMLDKQRRNAESKSFDVHYEASQVSMWKYQDETARTNEISDKHKAKLELTKAWSENQRARSLMKYIEGKTKALPTTELPTPSQSPRPQRSIEVAALDPVEIKPDAPKTPQLVPDLAPQASAGSQAKVRHLTRREVAMQLQEQIRRNEVTSYQSQIAKKTNHVSSHLPQISSHNQKLMDEATSLLVRCRQDRLQKEGSIRRKFPGSIGSKLDSVSAKSISSPSKRSGYLRQYGRQVVG